MAPKLKCIYSAIAMYCLNGLRILLVLLMLGAFAQPALADQTDTLLRDITPTNYQSVFARIDQTLLSLDSATAYRKAEFIINQARTSRVKGVLVRAYEAASALYQRHNDIPRAVEASAQACATARADRLTLALSRNLHMLGHLYRIQKKDGLALQAFLETLELSENLNSDKLRSEILYEMGNIYFHSENYAKAEDFLKGAIRVGSDSLRPRFIISAHNTLGMIHRNRGNLVQAEAEFELAMQRAWEKKDTAWVGIVSDNLGRLYASRGDYQKATSYYQNSLTISKKYKEWNIAVEGLIALGEINAKKGAYAVAEKYYQEALRMANQKSVFEPRLGLYKNLSLLYKQMGNFAGAYQYQVYLKEVSDSLEKQESNLEIERIQAAFDLNNRQTEVALLKKNNEIIQAETRQKNAIILAVSTILLCIIVLVIVLYLNNRQKNKRTRQLLVQQMELHQKNEQISSLNNTLEERVQERTQQLEAALKDLQKQNQALEQFSFTISHNLRSPIAHIMGLISIFNLEHQDDPLNLRILTNLQKSAENLNKVVADLNEILTMRNTRDIALEKIQLSAITDSVIESLTEDISKSEAILLIDFSEDDTVIAFASYAHSIVYNLLANAIKYRSDQRQLEIRIKTTISSPYVCLSVQDNGLGIELNQSDPLRIFKLYQRMHTHVEGRGMGLYLVKEHIETMGGKVEVESTPWEGSIFKIYFKRAAAAVPKPVYQ